MAVSTLVLSTFEKVNEIRMPGRDSSSVDTPVMYLEYVNGTIQNGATSFYLPTELESVDHVSITPTNQYGAVALLGVTSRVPVSSNIVRNSALQAGSTVSAVVLDSSASGDDDAYNNLVIEFPTLGEIRKITDYTGSTKTATLNVALPSAPSTIPFIIRGLTATCVDPGNASGGAFTACIHGRKS